MEPSLIGLAVALGVLLVGRAFGGAIIVGLFAAIPFQSTAFVTFPAMGGSSAPIATLFALLLISATLLRRGTVSDLRAVFVNHWTAWALVGLAIYVVLGAYLLPRIFEGKTSAFVPLQGVIFEVPLTPVSGNIAQACYFVLDTITFLLLCATLRRPEAWRAVIAGLFAFVITHAMAGIINLAGNMAGLGDVLLPIRTAGYAMLADQQEGGLWRIAGAATEASAFSALALACLGFCVAFWRHTGSRQAMFWGLVHLVLLLLSTSTTAYVGLAMVGGALGLSIALNATRGELPHRDLQLLGFCGVGLAMGLVAMLSVPAIIDAFGDLIDAMVFKKHLSSSGQERGYWNSQSVKAFFDTSWLGVGIGSSRASSWAVAVLSQTGIVGVAGFAMLLAAVWRAPNSISPAMLLPGGVRLRDVVYGTRAAVMANLLAASISGSNVDPGLLVFAGFAVCISASVMSLQANGPFNSRATRPSSRRKRIGGAAATTS